MSVKCGIIFVIDTIARLVHLDNLFLKEILNIFIIIIIIIIIFIIIIIIIVVFLFSTDMNFGIALFYI
jgi:hypothetical protein